MKYSFPTSDVQLYVFPLIPIDSRMYMLVAGNHVMIVDAVPSEDAVVLLREIQPPCVDIILTHEHYDHICGVNALKESFCCRVICTDSCAKAISDPRKNLSQYYNALSEMNPKLQNRETKWTVEPYDCTADVSFTGSYALPFQGHDVQLVHTPGHSKGSLCAVFDGVCIFTGDSLLADVPVVTKLPGGSRKDYEQKTLPFLKSFIQDTIIYPGHGRAAEIREIIL